MAYVASLANKSFEPKVVEILEKNYTEFERLTQNTPVRENRLKKDIAVNRGDAPDAGYEQTNTAGSHAKKEDESDFMVSIALARQEVQSISELTHDLSQSLRLEVTLSLLAERLKQLVPFDCIAVYLQEGAVLLPLYVNGQNSVLFQSLEIPIGQGLSGWVVENKKPIINGNPHVEPGYLDDSDKFSLSYLLFRERSREQLKARSDFKMPSCRQRPMS